MANNIKTEVQESGVAEQVRNVELADLAVTFDLPATRFQRELALLGWSMLVQEATRLAHADEFERNVGQRSIDPASLDVTPTWAHFVQAAKEFLPHLAARAPGTPTSPADRLTGYVYVLFDGMTGLSKIGHTKTEGHRQRAQMGGHGNVLVNAVNAVNAKVPDCLAAEAKCHEHFAQYRTNGEWFSAKLEDILQYIHVELDWLEIDYENQARLVQYILHCQSGDREEARAALMEGRRKHSRLKPTSSGLAFKAKCNIFEETPEIP
ncbi:T5orf domain-containing protein [Pseudomonas sp. GM102]|uniref:GIY-YIG nuclease family protein n=1 Tax=Pseudomonas sp. GM102 TaxID=1144321 RepID=UPI00026F9B19|nr:GIY-YIG nuclease family protein [Pseudomonas sp. GM102]EJM00976.1 T5orf domain-containing protein [Pseudomonas sp. GM102]